MLISDTEALSLGEKFWFATKSPAAFTPKDESLYDFDEAATECAKNFTGWATLASQPPYPYKRFKLSQKASSPRALKPFAHWSGRLHSGSYDHYQI